MNFQLFYENPMISWFLVISGLLEPHGGAWRGLKGRGQTGPGTDPRDRSAGQVSGTGQWDRSVGQARGTGQRDRSVRQVSVTGQ